MNFLPEDESYAQLRLLGRQKRINGMCLLFVSVKAFLFSPVCVILDKTFPTVTSNVVIYQIVIGESGSTLSGGEKQRISIARAILKDAPIVILDEATSSVDPENEQALLSAIEELTKNKTLISIAHRLSTVQKADQIIVIDNGQVKQKGTHEQLSKKDGIYRNFLKFCVEATGWQL